MKILVFLIFMILLAVVIMVRLELIRTKREEQERRIAVRMANLEYRLRVARALGRPKEAKRIGKELERLKRC